MRWLARILEVLLVVLLVAAVALAVFIRRSFPDIDGEIGVAGLEARSQVIRDVNGVPHITADTAHDLFMTQGFVHAQDRFWQMDFWRHVSGGRLAELFGEGQIEADMFLRTLGFRHIAQQEYDEASDELRSTLDAYAEGVNAYMALRSGSALSFEYAVVGLQNPGYEPDPWTPVDTLAWSKVMAWDLRASLDEEIDRAVLSQTLPLEAVEQLYPPYPDGHPVIVTEDVSEGAPLTAASPTRIDYTNLLGRVGDAIEQIDRLTGGGLDGIGSNNWVVAGSRTETGSPLLANDPHLGIQMPSIWYENDLRCATVDDECPYTVTGFSFPGVPGVVLGHNERIAWGVTNEAPDSLDLFIERIDPSDPSRYEADGAMRNMEIRTEVIEVAGGESIDFSVRSTRHGPIISGLFGALDDLKRGGAVDIPTPYAVAMQWTALEPAGVFEAFLNLNRAGGWEEFREALSTFDIAAQNFVYADVDGHIGYQATGRVPIRAAGDGRYPVPGWTGDFDWTGFIPYDSMPREFDPERGYIATANQPVVARADPRFIGIDHSYGFRAKRIVELLSAMTDAGVADMAAIQLDTYDSSAEALVPHLLALDTESAEVREVQTILLSWSESENRFQMKPEAQGAAVYAAVWRHLLRIVFDELPESRPADGGSRYFVVIDRLLEAPLDTWWDRTDTPDRVEQRDEILEQALLGAHAELTEKLGVDPEAWRWGDLHIASFENQSLGQSGIAPIEALFNRTSPPRAGGGPGTVNAIGWLPPEGYEVQAVPSMRMVVDLGDLSRSVAVHTTGQSGHIFSTHYFDQNDLWIEGRAHPMRWTADQIAGAVESRLILVPSG